MKDSDDPLLSLNISAEYPGRPVFRGLELSMNRGEILGLVGQSGSGKSTLALSVLRLLDFKGGRATGAIRFEGRDLMQLPEDEMRQVRGRDIGLVLQSPLASLNPSMRIGAQLREAWKVHAGPKAGEAPCSNCSRASACLPRKPFCAVIRGSSASAWRSAF